ncbi:unnamed protein product [Rhizophagus irregularis]|nr:unnamed protein product [Rhizophagus irregularis]
MSFRVPTIIDSSSQDNAIRGTNDDAVTSKLSAVNTGYIQDKYLDLIRDTLISRQHHVNFINILKLIIPKFNRNEIQIGKGGTEIYAPDYCLISGDLREWEENIVSHLEEHHGFDRRSRNIELRGIHAYPDLQSQKDRYLSRGWTHVEAVDINEVHDNYIDPNEISRISKLEFLDELEEWRLLASHYCIAWAYIIEDISTKSLFDHAKIPRRSSVKAAGYDLYSASNITIPAKGKALVPTDLAVVVPEGTYGRVAPRTLRNSIDCAEELSS